MFNFTKQKKTGCIVVGQNKSKSCGTVTKNENLENEGQNLENKDQRLNN